MRLPVGGLSSTITASETAPKGAKLTGRERTLARRAADKDAKKRVKSDQEDNHSTLPRRIVQVKDFIPLARAIAAIRTLLSQSRELLWQSLGAWYRQGSDATSGSRTTPQRLLKLPRTTVTPILSGSWRPYLKS